MSEEQKGQANWDAVAEKAPDLYTQVTVPIFDKQTVTAEIVEMERLDGESGAINVRPNLKLEGEIEDTPHGNKKAPGWIWKPQFAWTLIPGKPEEKEQAERGIKDLIRLEQAAKVITKGDGAKDRDAIRLIPSLIGKKVVVKFSTSKGKKKNDDGEFPTFQNTRFSGVGETEAPAASAEDF